MTSLITETCLSLRPIGLSTAPGQAFCPSSGLLVFWSSAATESAASTATRSVPSMAGRAFADGSMMYRCDGWGLNICARLRGGSPARSAVLAQLMAAIELGEDLAGVLADDGPAPSSEPRLTPVHAALAVQFLTRQASRADWFEVSETVIRLVSAAITGPGRRPSPPRATTEMAWRRLADGTKQNLSYDPGASLHELARRQSVSPYHLSHVFHACTGTTVSAYRNQLRVREALERLAEGERSLTGLASDLGFADHAHLTRTIRREAGAVPSVLRRLLAAREHRFGTSPARTRARPELSRCGPDGDRAARSGAQPEARDR